MTWVSAWDHSSPDCSCSRVTFRRYILDWFPGFKLALFWPSVSVCAPVADFISGPLLSLPSLCRTWVSCFTVRFISCSGLSAWGLCLGLFTQQGAVFLDLPCQNLLIGHNQPANCFFNIFFINKDVSWIAVCVCAAFGRRIWTVSHSTDGITVHQMCESVKGIWIF